MPKVVEYNRRTVLAGSLGAALLASTPAVACSPVLDTPTSMAQEIETVRSLLSAWHGRSREGFAAVFRTRVSPDIEDAETLIAELDAIDPPSVPPMDLFEAHFADPNLIATTEFIVATPAGVIAACSEARADGMIESDCSGMPTLHLLLITFNGLRVSAITHLNSTSTAFPNAVLISRGGA